LFFGLGLAYNPSNSPTATEFGTSPTATVAGVAAPNEPRPFPNNIETLSSLKLATARFKFVSGISLGSIFICSLTLAFVHIFTRFLSKFKSPNPLPFCPPFGPC